MKNISGFKINELDLQHQGDEIKHNANEKKVLECHVQYIIYVNLRFIYYLQINA